MILRGGFPLRSPLTEKGCCKLSGIPKPEHSMASFAHIINPVSVPPDSDLYRAQPITFASMKAARDFARGQAHVTQFTAQYAEDRHMVPDGFVLTRTLKGRFWIRPRSLFSGNCLC